MRGMAAGLGEVDGMVASDAEIMRPARKRRHNGAFLENSRFLVENDLQLMPDEPGCVPLRRRCLRSSNNGVEHERLRLADTRKGRSLLRPFVFYGSVFLAQVQSA
jgi:hypothetical protein